MLDKRGQRTDASHAVKRNILLFSTQTEEEEEEEERDEAAQVIEYEWAAYKVLLYRVFFFAEQTFL